MPTLVTWDNTDKTIVLQRLLGDWTYEEYMKSAAETQALTATMSHTVHVIVDFTESKSYPTRLLSAGQTLDRNLPVNQGLVLVVQCPSYVRAVFDILIKMYPKVGSNSFYVDSIDEARAIIRSHESDQGHAAPSS